ncbi:MAG: LysM domain-containing protein [Anaerolineales bacterium]
MIRRIFGLILGLGLFLSSCNNATVQSTQTVIPTGILTPFHTVTPKPVNPTATILVVIPETPAPSPTPYLYTVKNEDTMLGIAYQFGISLQDLQAANPTVDPHFMGPGLQLVIPIGGEIPDIIPTPTAYPVKTKQPICYAAGDGGAWCIVTIQNDQGTSLENLSAWIGLYSSEGENFTSQIAYAPLNILHPGDAIPLMAYFAPPLPSKFTARSEVLSALEVEVDDIRYVDADVRMNGVEINSTGSQAVVNGEVLLPDDTPSPSQVWVLAVAYDSNGDIVGARKWKSARATKYELTVYSLGEMIDHMEVLTEVRP